MGITESLSKTETILNRIAWLSGKDKDKEFGGLMHLFNRESLEQCFQQLDGKKAPGIDGVDKRTYARNPENNIEDLLMRMKNMAYIPGPVRQVLIPKEGKPGATRPLGISNLEDKIVQDMMKRVNENAGLQLEYLEKLGAHFYKGQQIVPNLLNYTGFDVTSCYSRMDGKVNSYYPPIAVEFIGTKK